MKRIRGVRGLRIVSMLALGGLVAMCSPRAVCHVRASEPVKFTIYLMIEENGSFATDDDGEYIQLFDEKGNLLAYNDDVRAYLESHSDSQSKAKLAAKEQEFYLIDGKLYLDESGSMELKNLSQVMPVLFKYGSIDSGYTLEADDGTVYINPLDVNGESVYVARVGGTYEKLPAFTIASDGEIGYLGKGFVGEGDNEVSFVFDSNYFYDEYLNQLESIDGVIPDNDDESAPMFTGYYVSNGDERRQFVDIDGSIVLSAEDYKNIAGADARAKAEYCNVLTLSAEGADSLTVYSDIYNGSLYDDYQRTSDFGYIGGDILSQLSYDEDENAERGHFAGYYRDNDEGEATIQVVDGSGNVISDNIGVLDGNKEYFARFYHVLRADGNDEDTDIYFSDGKVYSDTELQSEISNIKDVIGDLPEDEEEEVHSDEKDMDGVSKKYFIGYYFSSDFGSDKDGDSEEEDVLQSEYDEEEFDPADVEIGKVKFADREGNIVFDPEDADIDGDHRIYQNFYTVTVWDDGEVEITEDADEVKDEVKLEEPEEVEEIIDEVVEEEVVEEITEEVTDETTGGEGAAEGAQGEADGTEGTDVTDGSATDKTTEESDESEDKEKGVEETAKPTDKDQTGNEGSDSGDGGNGDGGNGDGGNSDGEGGVTEDSAAAATTEAPAEIPAAENDGE